MMKKDLLKKVVYFLEQEKEVYGDFSPDFPASGTGDAAANNLAGLSVKTTDSVDVRLRSCESLRHLQELCTAADDLRTDLADTNLVFGTGNPDADLMIIGEAPGFHEDQQCEPFVGKAGQLLNNILAAIQFSREEVYITNIVKHRPPDNRDPLKEERQKSLPYLRRQIELVDPVLILCLGRISAVTLLDRENTLANMRGKFYPFMNRQLLVTYHPAALLRNPQWKRPTWEDVRLLREKYDQLTRKES